MSFDASKVMLSGWRRDPHNLVYPTISEFRSTLRAKATGGTGDYFIKELIPCLDQGDFGACVIHSWASAQEIVLGLKDPNFITPLSRNFLYGECRSIMGTFGEDSGTYPWLAGDRLKKVGCALEKDWPYTKDLRFRRPPVEVYTFASDNRAVEAYRITSYGEDRLNDIELALRANHPVIFGTRVGEQIFTWAAGDPPLEPPKDNKGGHSMVWTGIARDRMGRRRFWTRNHWSTEYGDNGHLWMDEDYVLLSDTSDLWVVTRDEPIS